MDELILKVLQGRASPDERQDLQMRRAIDSRFDVHFRFIEEIWELTGAAATSMEALPPKAETVIALSDLDPSSDEGFTEATTSATAARPRGSRNALSAARRASVIRRFGHFAIAASVAIIAFGAGLLINRGEAPHTPVGIAEIVTVAGEMVTLILEDGSAIRLGPRSSLRLTGEGGDRIATLTGRAFFAIESDPTRQFIVRTNQGEAVVLGTRFGVRAEDRDFEVVVVEGSVRVSASGASVDVDEGLVSRSLDGAPPSTTPVGDTDSYLAWMGRSLLFQGTSLRRVIAEIEAHYNLAVLLEDPALGELTVTATFTDRPLEEVIAVVCTAIGAECSIEDGLVRIGLARDGASANS